MKKIHALSLFLLVFGAFQPAHSQVAGVWADCPTGQGNASNSNLIIPSENVNLSLFAGSFIGVFTPDGDCIGASYFNGDPTKAATVVLWGRDDTAPDPRGADAGEAFEIRVLNEVAPEVTSDVPLAYEPDTIYRVLTGDYPESNGSSAEIQQLREQVEQLEQDLASMTAERDSLLSQLDDELARIGALQEEVDTLSSENDNLHTQVSQYQTALAEEQDKFTYLLGRVNTVRGILNNLDL